MNADKDYYAILGVSQDADSTTIEEAYERLAKEVQPNVDLEPTNPERMQELDEAFDVLDDPERRAEYDAARQSTGDGDSTAATAGVAAAAGAAAASGADTAATGDETPPATSDEVGSEPEPSSTTSGQGRGGLIAGIALLAGGIVAIVAAVAFAAFTLTDDDDDSSSSGEVTFTDTTEGTGATPETGQIVTMHLTGMLEDDTVFASTEGGEPFAFIVGQAPIPGLDQGVATMKEGGERTMEVPPELAFGAAGAEGVPPNSTITLDVQLLAISDPSPTTPPEVDGVEMDLGSDLKAIDIEEGTGAEVKTGDRATVHYSGWLTADGTRFDTSLGRDADTPPSPFTFGVGAGEVIEGWDLGLVGMKVGGIRRLIIPGALAYGPEGSPPTIPPDASLTFDIELIEIPPPLPTISPSPAP
jgi:peptidylprolyl isomerase